MKSALLIGLISMNSFSVEPILQQSLDRAVQQTLLAFAGKNLQPIELAATVVDLQNRANPVTASYRGDIRIYPASVVKLFYLEAVHRWMEDGKIRDTPELRRAMSDMIVDSYNEATHYIVDLLTGTTSGPELPPTEMAQWEYLRNGINRYFSARGYTNLNVNQKPWCEGPYGRERVFVGEKFSNRNALTTDATARLLTEIVRRTAVSAKRSEEMLALLKRDPFSTSSDPDDQARGFTGAAVPDGGKLWSKAGWTSQTRHDAAYLELPNGTRFVLVIFTVNHSNERGIIPALAKNLIKNMGDNL
jgi:hypothetical protein